MLHFKSKEWYIGDVHPYYHDNKLYLFYLKPNGIIRCDACFEDPTKVVCGNSVVAISENYVDFEEYLLDIPVVNIVEKDGIYYTNVSDVQGTMESRDLLHWKTSEHFKFKADLKVFPAGTRDHAFFYDEDQEGMRVTMLAYETNEHNGFGAGIDCCVGISDVIPYDGDGMVAQRGLFPINNQGVDLMCSREPECNQMLKIGKRWYLLTSLARQTVHWVGPLSYWIGNENTPIDQDDFRHKKEYRLDGEDLSAAQIAPNGERYYKFGWIPMNYNGQEWGGHLNFPHEVYQLEDGRLACRLDPAFARSIVKNEKSHDIFWGKYIAEFGRCVCIQSTSEFGLRACIDLRNSEKSGLILDREKGIGVEIERKMNSMRVVCKKVEGIFCYAQLELDSDVWSDIAIIHAIYDEDIIEVFLNDKYTLCARTEVKNHKNVVGVFSDREIRWIRSYELKRPDKKYHLMEE